MRYDNETERALITMLELVVKRTEKPLRFLKQGDYNPDDLRKALAQMNDAAHSALNACPHLFVGD